MTFKTAKFKIFFLIFSCLKIIYFPANRHLWYLQWSRSCVQLIQYIPQSRHLRWTFDLEEYLWVGLSVGVIEQVPWCYLLFTDMSLQYYSAFIFQNSCKKSVYNLLLRSKASWELLVCFYWCGLFFLSPLLASLLWNRAGMMQPGFISGNKGVQK